MHPRDSREPSFTPGASDHSEGVGGAPVFGFPGRRPAWAPPDAMPLPPGQAPPRTGVYDLAARITHSHLHLRFSFGAPSATPRPVPEGAVP
jgi:hypothetical protein